MANRLAGASSPYLQQHATNPVDWYPWGGEAFAKAKELSRPILLSIGYSACHWCHVMARESFSNPETAALMNAGFINVKVDREERPDVDAIHMAALQTLTGSGGWPLTVVLTPEGEPFFAGTYWPDQPRHGLPDFRTVLQAVLRAWTDNPAEVTETAADLTRHLRQQVSLSERRSALSPAVTEAAVEQLLSTYDERHGGFGAAPKFPAHSTMRFLLERSEPAARDMALGTLRNMARGGIFDQLGGGLARYTVDEAWLVPHFEKMLFDSAQFLGLCALAFRASGEPGFRRAALLSADWLRSDLMTEAGTFMAALSAESGGVEGGYYLWTATELEQLLAAAGLADLAGTAWGASEAGNHEGRNILTLSRTAWEQAEDPRLEEARRLLLTEREKRLPPDLDHKVITSWNGLAIENLALAGRLLEEPQLIREAGRSADHLMAQLTDGSLRHSSTGGPLLLEDLAFLGNGLLVLYRATLDEGWLDGAVTAAERVLADFSEDGILYSTAASGEKLLLRPRGLSDAGVPADTAEAARLLLGTGDLRDNRQHGTVARATLEAAATHVAGQPVLMGSSLAAIDAFLTADGLR